MSWIARLTALALLAGTRSYAQPPARWSGADEYLSRAFGVTAAELAAVARGEPVVKQLPVREERDVAMLAAVDVMVPTSWFTERQRDVRGAFRPTSERAAQHFSTPARDADVRLLQVTAEEIDALSKCRPKACDFKLPAGDMSEARALTAGADAASRVTAYVRGRMVAFVNDYRRRGDSALVVYDDRAPVRATDAFAAMFRDWTPVYEGLASSRRLMTHAAPDSVAASGDAILWAINEITGVRPTLRILHAMLYSPPELPAASALVVRQLYANHYLEAGLELLIAVQRPGASVTTLIALGRYRFDNLQAGPVNVRRRISSGLESNMVGELRRLKRESESAWARR